MSADVVVCAPCMFCIRANCNVQRKFETVEPAELWQQTFSQREFNVTFVDCKHFTSTASYLQAYRSCENNLIKKFKKQTGCLNRKNIKSLKGAKE